MRRLNRQLAQQVRGVEGVSCVHVKMEQPRAHLSLSLLTLSSLSLSHSFALFLSPPPSPSPSPSLYFPYSLPPSLPLSVSFPRAR
jgi:hypothetical protein